MSFVQDYVTLHNGPPVHIHRDVKPGIVLPRPWAWERVLINLLLNSVRAMPDGGNISILARQLRDHIEIIVTDEGTGIPAELLPHLFKPHVSTKAGGGLGLHIVNSIVRSEEGEVTVANRVEGGAEFTIIVPHSSIPAFTRSATA